jgi:hypothetical protein
MSISEQNFALIYFIQKVFKPFFIRSDESKSEPFLQNKYDYIRKRINESMIIVKKQRPSGLDILKEKHLWAYSFDDISSYLQQNNISIDLVKEYIYTEFVSHFLQSKHAYKNHFIIF